MFLELICEDVHYGDGVGDELFCEPDFISKRSSTKLKPRDAIQTLLIAICLNLPPVVSDVISKPEELLELLPVRCLAWKTQASPLVEEVLDGFEA